MNGRKTLQLAFRKGVEREGDEEKKWDEMVDSILPLAWNRVNPAVFSLFIGSHG
jgi:hypothetical protein